MDYLLLFRNHLSNVGSVFQGSTDLKILKKHHALQLTITELQVTIKIWPKRPLPMEDPISVTTFSLVEPDSIEKIEQLITETE
jgi:hypothetical protein